MARIDIEIEDYLDEVDTRTLIRELSKRKDRRGKYKIDINEFIELTGIEQERELPDRDNLLRYIKKLLGLREWHDKDRVMAEIKEL